MDLINISIGLGTGGNEQTAPGSHGFLDGQIQECESLSEEFQGGWENSSMSSVPEMGKVGVAVTHKSHKFIIPLISWNKQEREWIHQIMAGELIHNPLSSLSRKALPDTDWFAQLLHIEFSAFSEAMKGSLKFCLA